MKINLNNLTELEKTFVKAAVANWNDLMFGNDLDYRDNTTVGISPTSLGGIMSSLSKKGIIGIDPTADDTAFQFIGDDGDTDYNDSPELVEA